VRRLTEAAATSGYLSVNNAARVPMTRADAAMTDRVTTLHDLTNPHRTHGRPGLFQLRVLERELRGRVAELDDRVDGLLDFVGIPTEEHVAEVDVLCAAITEQQELLDEVRAEAARHLERSHERRSHPRRWA
jgi:hypothetical protein